MKSWWEVRGSNPRHLRCKRGGLWLLVLILLEFVAGSVAVVCHGCYNVLPAVVQVTLKRFGSRHNLREWR